MLLLLGDVGVLVDLGFSTKLGSGGLLFLVLSKTGVHVWCAVVFMALANTGE